MRCDTVVYLEKDNKILMLLRNKKENDINEGKYIGVGGKIENNESPYEGAVREVFEETGLKVNKLEYRGLITFVYENQDAQYIFVFSSKDFEGELIECNEGTLQWIKKENIMDLNIWEGDKDFLKKIINEDYKPFMIKNYYNKDELIKKEIEL